MASQIKSQSSKQTLETSFYKTNLYSAPRFAQTWNDFSKFTKIYFHFLRNFALAAGSGPSTTVVFKPRQVISLLSAQMIISHVQSISNDNWWEWSTIRIGNRTTSSTISDNGYE